MLYDNDEYNEDYDCYRLNYSEKNMEEVKWCSILEKKIIMEMYLYQKEQEGASKISSLADGLKIRISYEREIMGSVFLFCFVLRIKEVRLCY